MHIYIRTPYQSKHNMWHSMLMIAQSFLNVHPCHATKIDAGAMIVVCVLRAVAAVVERTVAFSDQGRCISEPPSLRSRQVTSARLGIVARTSLINTHRECTYYNAMELRLDPTEVTLPKRSELPTIPNAPAGAAWFWGSNDEV